MFILASSVCTSLQCLISALVQGGKGGHLFRLTCSVVGWGGRNTANTYRWHVWRLLTLYGLQWVCPSSQPICLPCLHCSGSKSLCRELSKASPRFCAIPRSKLLRFGFLSTPQRHRVDLECILCPFQVQGAQETRCLVSTLSQVGSTS